MLIFYTLIAGDVLQGNTFNDAMCVIMTQDGGDFIDDSMLFPFSFALQEGNFLLPVDNRQTPVSDETLTAQSRSETASVSEPKQSSLKNTLVPQSKFPVVPSPPPLKPKVIEVCVVNRLLLY